jgi:hypothetical protein
MPLDHRFRVDHDKRLFPPGPEPPRHDPEQLIEYRKPWPCVPPFQCRELLAKSKVFKKQHASGEKHAKDRAKQESEDVCHATLLRHFACEMQCCFLLKSKADRILANDTGSFRVVDQEFRDDKRVCQYRSGETVNFPQEDFSGVIEN